jgi:hexosaminidase
MCRTLASCAFAYPQYACQDSTGKQLLFQGEFCPKPESAQFIADILDEVISIFPSEYIHIGGDEASKVAWHKCPVCRKTTQDLGLKNVDELQSNFIKTLEKHLNSRGRKMIGWDEIRRRISTKCNCYGMEKPRKWW